MSYHPGLFALVHDPSISMQKVVINIATRDIVGKNILSESDPFVVVSMKDDNVSDDFIEIGRTEVVQGKRDADFEERISMDFYFDREQLLKFDVYDWDKKCKSSNLKDDNFIGTLSIPLGEIIHGSNCTIKKQLKSKTGTYIKNKKTKEFATIIVQAEAAPHDRNHMLLKFSGSNLPKMDSLLGKVDPYFRICRMEMSQLQKLSLKDCKERARNMQYRSETIKRDYNPNWKQFEISEGKLFYAFEKNIEEIKKRNPDSHFTPSLFTELSDISKMFEVQIYDWNSNKEDDFIGYVLIKQGDLKQVAKEKKPKMFEIDPHGIELVRRFDKLQKKPTLILENVTYIANLYDFVQNGGSDFKLMLIKYTLFLFEPIYRIDTYFNWYF